MMVPIKAASLFKSLFKICTQSHKAPTRDTARRLLQRLRLYEHNRRARNALRASSWLGSDNQQARGAALMDSDASASG